MKKDLVKISGGIAVMFSVFLLLATIKQATNKNSVSTKLINPPNGINQIEQAPIPNENVLKGSFNVNTPGNVIRSYDENGNIFYHYKAINSPELKNGDAHPILKLEIKLNNQIIWKEVPWNWIDYDQGILYFHFKTVENEKEKITDNYTGRYQLILE